MSTWRRDLPNKVGILMGVVGSLPAPALLGWTIIVLDWRALALEIGVPIVLRRALLPSMAWAIVPVIGLPAVACEAAEVILRRRAVAGLRVISAAARRTVAPIRRRR